MRPAIVVGPRRRRGVPRGSANVKYAPFGAAFAGADGAAVRFDDRLGDRESHAGAAAAMSRAGLLEHPEHGRLGAGRKPGTLVGHATSTEPGSARARTAIAPRRARAALSSRLREHAFDQHRVEFNRRQVGGQVDRARAGPRAGRPRRR